MLQQGGFHVTPFINNSRCAKVKSVFEPRFTLVLEGKVAGWSGRFRYYRVDERSKYRKLLGIMAWETSLFVT